ncbi:MAG: class I SAM-dependent methyltransferase [Chloroflexi bacterium]|nr:class I SAM-dependent methyltransferase [Chloroflexota bacterium]MCY3937278.1 class I SAM-dependent methyltransferase [Chloroflexota bacterium]
MLESYGDLYDRVYGAKDYAAETEKLRGIVHGRSPGAKTVLDVACGTGQHLYHLRRHYDAEGLDLSEAQLQIARKRNPDCTLHLGDMLTFDLTRRFDVVTCLFSSVGYLRSVEALNQAVANMARHVKPGGLLVVEPWLTPESWLPGTLWSDYVDQPNLKVARISVSELNGRLALIDFHILVAHDAEVDYFRERHELTLFTEDEYMASFSNAGLDVTFDPEGLIGRGLYVSLTPG